MSFQIARRLGRQRQAPQEHPYHLSLTFRRGQADSPQSRAMPLNEVGAHLWSLCGRDGVHPVAAFVDPTNLTMGTEIALFNGGQNAALEVGSVAANFSLQDGQVIKTEVAGTTIYGVANFVGAVATHVEQVSSPTGWTVMGEFTVRAAEWEQRASF